MAARLLRKPYGGLLKARVCSVVTTCKAVSNGLRQSLELVEPAARDSVVLRVHLNADVIAAQHFRRKER